MDSDYFSSGLKHFFEEMDRLEKCNHDILMYEGSDFYRSEKINIERKYYVCSLCGKRFAFEFD